MEYGSDIGYEAEPNSRYEEQHELRPFDDFVSYLREYARENPEMAALACFSVGFIVGWKLKPW